MWVAGLFEHSDKYGPCYATITTEPPEWVVPIHDRMLAVVDFDDGLAFLRGETLPFGPYAGIIEAAPCESPLKRKGPGPPQGELFSGGVFQPPTPRRKSSCEHFLIDRESRRSIRFGSGPPAHSPVRRLRFLLRVGRAAPGSRPARPAGGRGSGDGGKLVLHRRQLRGQGVRRENRHPHQRRPHPVPRHRHRGVQAGRNTSATTTGSSRPSRTASTSRRC